jgi:CRP-like cAMP-binding protein
MTLGSKPTRESKNLILRFLAPSAMQSIDQHLERVELLAGQVIYDMNAPIRYVYFVEKGLVSLVKSMKDGRTVEVGVVGIDGMTGVSGLLGIGTAAFESVVQIPGAAHRIRLNILHREAENHEPLRTSLLRYAHFVLSAVAQTAACHRLHSLEERCCRWLLVAHDNAQSDSFPLTHQFLAIMLGVGRSYVSVTASALRRQGLIRYARGWITITDRSGLEAAACECYGALRDDFEHLFGTIGRKRQNR